MRDSPVWLIKFKHWNGLIYKVLDKKSDIPFNLQSPCEFRSRSIPLLILLNGK